MYKKSLTLALVLICSAFAFAATCGTGTTSGMLAYYTFDNASDLGIDYYNSNNGTNSGGITYIPGGVSNGASWHNHGGHVMTVPYMDFSGDFTIAAWVKTTANSNTPNIIVMALEGGLATPPKLFFTVRHKKIYIESTAGSLYGSHNINDNEWHLAVLTRSGNNWSTYTDNNAPTSSIQDSGDHSGHMDIGGGYIPTWSFNGGIDELAVFDRALSQSEILELYNLGNNDQPYCGLGEQEVVPEVGSRSLQIFVILIVALLIGAALLKKN